MKHPFPVGTRVCHSEQKSVIDTPGGMAKVSTVSGKQYSVIYGEYWMYTILTTRDGKPPSKDNPLVREVHWPSYYTVEAKK